MPFSIIRGRPTLVETKMLLFLGLKLVPSPTCISISSPGLGSKISPVTVYPCMPSVSGIFFASGSPTFTQIISPRSRISTLPSSRFLGFKIRSWALSTKSLIRESLPSMGSLPCAISLLTIDPAGSLAACLASFINCSLLNPLQTLAACAAFNMAFALMCWPPNAVDISADADMLSFSIEIEIVASRRSST